jgi:undecaprenyl-diphosphatase
VLTLDQALFEALNAGPATPWALIALARWTSVTLPWIVGAALALWCTFGTRENRRLVAWAAVSMGITWIGVHLLRWGFPAPRPAQLGVGIQWLEHGARAGFPSMHAAQAFALAASLALGRTPRWLAVAAFSVAVAIAWSRVFLGVHFPLDVLAGACTGLLSAGAARALADQMSLSSQRRSSAYWSRLARPWARRK